MGRAAQFLASFAGSFGAVLLFMLIAVGGFAISTSLGAAEPIAGAIGLGSWYIVRYFISRRFSDPA